MLMAADACVLNAQSLGAQALVSTQACDTRYKYHPTICTTCDDDAASHDERASRSGGGPAWLLMR